jgi:hypothetical protein
MRAALAIPIALFASTASAQLPTKEACIAANERGQDLKSNGKLQSARIALLVCMDNACPGPVREDCARLLEEVNKAQPSIVFEAKDGGGNDLSNVRVLMDGLLLVDRLDGKAINIDPGPHRFRFEASGAEPVERRFIIREGEKARVERIVLAQRPADPPPPVKPPPPPPRSDPPPYRPDPKPYVPAPTPPPTPSKSRWPYGRSAFQIGFSGSPEMRFSYGDFADFMDQLAPNIDGEKLFGGTIMGHVYIRVYHGLMIGGFGGVRIGPNYHGADFKGIIRGGGSLRFDFAHSDKGKEHAAGYLAAHGAFVQFGNGKLCDASSLGVPSSACPAIKSKFEATFGAELGADVLINTIGLGIFTRVWYGRAAVFNKDGNTSSISPSGKEILYNGDQLYVNLSGWEIIGLKVIFGI